MKRLFVLLKNPCDVLSRKLSEEEMADFVASSQVFKKFDRPYWEELWVEKLEANELNLVINKLNIVYKNLFHFNNEKKLVLQVSTELKNSLFIKNKNKLEAQLEKFKSVKTEDDFLSFNTDLARTQDEIFESEDHYMGVFEDEPSMGFSGFVSYESKADFEYEVLGIYAYHI